LPEEKVIKTHVTIMNELKGYASPKAGLTRLLKSGKLGQVRRGLFVDDLSLPHKTLAPVLYGPSYSSFHYALASYDLIPKRIVVITSAGFDKNKNTIFHTPLKNLDFSISEFAAIHVSAEASGLEGVTVNLFKAAELAKLPGITSKNED